MRRKDARKLIDVLSQKFGVIEASKVEIAEFEEKKIFILNSNIEFIEDGNGLFPFLGGSYLEILPRVVVDMGAIRFVCNGADIMAPGITELDEFNEGAVVVIRDVTHGKGLAVGISKKDSSEIELNKKGKVIKNIHYVGDKLWEAALA
jgi:PUA domain protein